MSSHFTVVYDACVLYPAPLRDLLMRLALTDRFRARWSDAIHDEWIRNLRKQRPELDPAALEKTRTLMNSSVRDSLVEGFEHLIPAIELPDPDDRHVVSAAIHSGAETIVTFNLKDFQWRHMPRGPKRWSGNTYCLQKIWAVFLRNGSRDIPNVSRTANTTGDGVVQKG